MSIGSIIGGGIRLVRTQPQTVTIWAALYFAAMIVLMVAMRPFYAEMAAMQQQAAVNAAAGIKAAPPFDGRFLGFVAILELVLLLFGIVAFAAVVRATVRPGGDRFAYLRLGMDELRLVGLLLLLVIAVVLIEIVAIIGVVLIVAAVRAAAGMGASVVVGILLWLAVVLAVIWAEVRISLAAPLTVLRGRIVIRDAWRATRGRFWTLFVVSLLMGIAFGIVTMIYVAVTNPGLVMAYASFDPRLFQAAAQEQLQRQAAGLSLAMVVQAIIGSILFVAMGAALFGAMATAAIESEADRFNESRATAA